MAVPAAASGHASTTHRGPPPARSSLRSRPETTSTPASSTAPHSGGMRQPSAESRERHSAERTAGARCSASSLRPSKMRTSTRFPRARAVKSSAAAVATPLTPPPRTATFAPLSSPS